MSVNLRRYLIAAGVGAVALAAVLWGILHGSGPAALPTTQHVASATSSTAPSSIPTSQRAPTTDYLGVVRDSYPDFSTIEPLALPAALHEGARLVLRDPIYLDSFQELWITRSDAAATPAEFKHAEDEQVHLTRQHVVFVHHFLDDSRQWQPQIVCRDAEGNFQLISAEGTLKLGNRFDYQWDRAFDWNSDTNEGFVVPTGGGISIFRPRSLPVEMHYDFVPASTQPSTTVATTESSTQPSAKPQALLDNRGLLAWIPWENGGRGSRGAARFVDGQWQPLGPEQSWPEKIMQLIPLVGGGVQQLVVNDDGTVGLLLAQLDAAGVDVKVVDPLIQQLSDPDPKIREAAFDELTRYGPGLWPILEKEIEDQPPDGHLLMQRLLAAKQNPTLGKMTLLPGAVHALARLEDGGVLLIADAGVSIPNVNPAVPPVVISPAYISIHPGRPIELAPPPLVKDLSPDAHFDVAPDEWIVSDAAHGPRRLLGNHLEPLLKKSELNFSHFIGIDRRGRWLFREPDSQTPTLLLDPNLPDITPHLPGWIDPVACDVVGWDDAGWPVMMKHDNAWALHAEDWSPLPAANAGRKFYQALGDTAVVGATSGPATTQATTSQSAPILVDSEGSKYFDGLSSLEIHHADGSIIRWPLPDAAVGTGEVHLLRTADKHLFLINAPGRVLRIKPTPDRASPFEVEATFTRAIPNADHYTRVWLDPAGRLDLEFDVNHLTILFPEGRVPRAIAEKMPAEQLKGGE